MKEHGLGTGAIVAIVVGIIVAVGVPVTIAAVLLSGSGGGGGGASSGGGTQGGENGSTTPQLYSTDPANVVLKSSDLPSGWDVAFDNDISLELNTSLGNLIAGYDASYVRGFGGEIVVGVTPVYTNIVLRYPSIENAQEVYSNLYNGVASDYVENVSAATVGDESYFAMDDGASKGVFRKSNFVVWLHFPVSVSDVVNLAQICENRIA